LKPCLAILAHAGASATLADFQPRWERLGLPLLAFVPYADTWPGRPVHQVYHQGASVHAGAGAIARFTLAVETLVNLTHFDRYLLMEYDTVNLADTLPALDWSVFNGGFMHCHGPETPAHHYQVSFSPWAFTRSVGQLLLAAIARERARPSHPTWTAGLVDRWLAAVCLERGLPFKTMPDTLGYPFPECQPLAYIAAQQINFVHGYKSAAAFQELWPGV